MYLYLLTCRDYSPNSKMAIDKISIHDVNTAVQISSFTLRQRVQRRETITIALGKTLVYVLDGIGGSIFAYGYDSRPRFKVSLREFTHRDSSVCLHSSSSNDFVILENNLRLQAISTADSHLLWTFDMPKKGVFKNYFGYGMFVEINGRKISILDMRQGK